MAGMLMQDLPFEIQAKILGHIPDIDGSRWHNLYNFKHDIIALILVNKTFNTIVTALTYGRFPIGTTGYLFNMDDESLIMTLLEQEKHPRCINTLTTLIRRVRTRAAQLARIVHGEDTDESAFAERHARAFTAAVRAYLGRSLLLEHFRSSNMLHEVALRGSQLSDDDWVALAALWLGEEAVLSHHLKGHDPPETFYFVAMLFCAWKGNLDMIYFLEQHGNSGTLRLSVQNDLDGEILRTAVDNHHPETVKTLLADFVVDPKAIICPWMITPLHAAAIVGDVDGMRICLDRGIDVNSRVSEHTETPLHYVAMMKSGDALAAAKFLVENGADIEARGKFDSTPLMRFAESTGPLAHVARYLLESGADPNVGDDVGSTVLSNAIESSNVELVEKLVEYGVDLNASIKRAGLSLAQAIKRGDNTMFNLLVKHGAHTANLKIGKYTTMSSPGNDRLGLIKNLIDLQVDLSELRVRPGPDSAEVLGLLLECTCTDKQTLNSRIWFQAVEAGCNTVIEKLLERGVPAPSLVQLCPGAFNTLEPTLRLLIRAGIPLGKDQVVELICSPFAAKYLSWDMIKLLFDTYIQMYEFTLTRAHPWRTTTALLFLAIKVASETNCTERAWMAGESLGWGSFFSDIVRFFLDQGPKVTITDGDPTSVIAAVVAANKCRHGEALIELFLDHFNDRRIDFRQLIGTAIDPRVNLPILRCLLDRFADCKLPPEEWRDAIGYLTLQAVDKSAQYEIVELFLQYQREPNAFREFLTETVRADGKNPFEVLFEEIPRNVTVIRLLHVHGAFADVPANDLIYYLGTVGRLNKIRDDYEMFGPSTEPRAPEILEVLEKRKADAAARLNVDGVTSRSLQLLRTLGEAPDPL